MDVEVCSVITKETLSHCSPKSVLATSACLELTASVIEIVIEREFVYKIFVINYQFIFSPGIRKISVSLDRCRLLDSYLNWWMWSGLVAVAAVNRLDGSLQ